jgi:hypothetical protein
MEAYGPVAVFVPATKGFISHFKRTVTKEFRVGSDNAFFQSGSGNY